MATYAVPGYIIAAACVLSLLVNVFSLVVFAKRRRLHRRAHLAPLFLLAAVGVVAAVTWSVVSVVIAVLDWDPPGTACKAHAYFRSLWSLFHVHSLALLAVERCLRMWGPSRHAQIFTPRVTAFLLAGLATFDVLVASVTHYGYLDFVLVREELNCAADYRASTETLALDVSVTWAVPYLGLIIPCLAGAVIKVILARGRAGTNGEILLETSPYVTTHAYTQRLQGFQDRFKQVGTRAAKPRLGDKVFTSQGYVTESDSDINDVSGPELRAPRKVMYLARREHVLTKTYMVLAGVYALCWLPHVALTFRANYDPFSAPDSDLRAAAATLTHWPHVLMPVFLFAFNPSFRKCAGKTLCCRKSK